MVDELGQLRPPTTPKGTDPVLEAAEVYKTLRGKITDGYEQAKKDGKKFYVVMAEQHTSSRSLLVEVMAADIIRRLDPERKDIGRLILERSPTQLQEAIQKEQLDSNFAVMANLGNKTLKLPTVPMDEEKSAQLLKTYAVAIKGDKKAQEEYSRMISEGMPRRDTLFADTIADQPGGVVVMGAMHSKGVLTNLGNQKGVSVLPLNITSVTPAPGQNLHPLLEYALNKDNMQPITLKAVPEDMDVPATISMAQKAIGIANSPGRPESKKSR